MKIKYITGNQKKTDELKRIILEKNLNLDIDTLNLEIEEIQSENYQDILNKKIEFVQSRTNFPFIIDDTRIEISNKPGFPGPYAKFVNEVYGYDFWSKNTTSEDEIIVTTTICYNYLGRNHFFEGTLNSKISANVTDLTKVKSIFEILETDGKIMPREMAFNKFVEFVNSKQKEDSIFYVNMADRWDSRSLKWSEEIKTETHYANWENGYERWSGLAKKILPAIIDGEILDYGCGSGDVSMLLRENSKLPILSVDVSGGMIEEVKKKNIPNNTQMVGEINSLIIDKKFGLVATRGIVISHTPFYSVLPTLENLVSKVEENGYFLIDFLQNIDNGDNFQNVGEKFTFNINFLDKIMNNLGLIRIDHDGDFTKRVVTALYHRKNKNSIYFATSNPQKILELNHGLEESGLNLIMCNLDLQEIQTSNLLDVVNGKAKEAFEKVGVPVICTDGGIFIEEIKGFPGVYSKNAMQTIGVVGILKIMENVVNRKAKRINAISFYDGQIFVNKLAEVELTITQKEVEPKFKCYPMDKILIPVNDKQDRTYGEIPVQERHLFTELGEFVAFIKDNFLPR